MHYKLLRNPLKLIALISLPWVFIAGCSDNGTDTLTDKGTLMVKLTDAPFPIEQVDQAHIGIFKIEIRQTDEQDGNPFRTVWAGDTTLNFMELRNGITAYLPPVELPVGSFDMVRIYVDSAVITLKDGSIFDMKVPSGAQTGIKVFIKPAIEVAGGLTAELLLDFDMNKSFVVQGNPHTPAGIKGFIFKPVIRAVNQSAAGRFEGLVSDTADAPLANAMVWAEQDSVVATAFTDSSGYYALVGMPIGTYDLYATKTEYDTISVSDAVITAANRTEHNFILIQQ
ncbi:MAG: DUF4382 domain-containing protein [Caldithrix sp.]|nr:DUF4382 domain-containing protein [Caldithrix sp.]